MSTLKTLIPDAESLLSMHPADLSGFVLEALLDPRAAESGSWNRRNFCGAAGQAYSVDVRSRGPRSDVAEACAEAWSWLEANWLICPSPEQGNDWYIPTRRGKELRDRTGVRALVESEELPAHFLHRTMLRDVRPLFLQARYDSAVFQAFLCLEVAIRDAATLGNELIGTKLVARAFHPDDGPLTDLGAEAGERQAVMNLMSGAIGSYKNPQSHRQVGLTATEAREMIIIASHLLTIVDCAPRNPRT